ncbi:hypothetical protein ACQP2F_31730 [Actinoplanes sp. CA-030573]|uniref:hypothetical protein n=1 Tax=Actinoplanes sp. CA-030573 TaxID=3239898 RepID=UPI003D8CCF7E
MVLAKLPVDRARHPAAGAEMSLTGSPLIACSILATIAVLAGTVVAWFRAGFLLRTAGVLLGEVLLVLSVGLVVNRSQGFYPNWAALLHSGRPAGTTYAVRPGHLDGWLRARTAAGQGYAFAWQPAGWTGWHLAGAPLVAVPAGYLAHPAWRYPALLILDDGRTGWTAPAETAAARSAVSAAGPAVMVFVRTTAATGTPPLTAALPAALARDLRVTTRRWALIAPATDAVLADRTVAAAPAYYPALALVQPVSKLFAKPPSKPLAKPLSTPLSTPPRKPLSTPPPKPLSKPPPKPLSKPLSKPAPKPLAKPAAKARGAAGLGHPVAAVLPAGIDVTVVRTVLTAATTAAPSVEAALTAALTWACRQTPPPLAASTPAAASLPVYRHPTRSPSPSAPALPREGRHVPR